MKEDSTIIERSDLERYIQLIRTADVSSDDKCAYRSGQLGLLYLMGLIDDAERESLHKEMHKRHYSATIGKSTGNSTSDLSRYTFDAEFKAFLGGLLSSIRTAETDDFSHYSYELGQVSALHIVGLIDDETDRAIRQELAGNYNPKPSRKHGGGGRRP